MSIVSRKELATFSRFVYDVYAANNAGDLGWEPNEEEIREFIEEDTAYFPRSLYVWFKAGGTIPLSTLKITHYTPELLFPIEKQFNLPVSELAKRAGISTEEFYHLGRLSVDKNRLSDMGPSSRELFTRMLHRCLLFTTWSPQGTIFAEAALPAVQLFEKIGCPFEVVGDPDFHTGTYTYPVVLRPDVIRNWLASNEDLM